MKKTNKLSVLFFAALLASYSVVSCASSDTTDTTDIAAVTETTADVVTEPIDPIASRTLQDEVPELDFGGVPFRTIVQQSCVDDIWVESAIGEVLNDAVFDRNMKIQERFNIVIEATPMDYSDISSVIRKAVSAGDDAYELVLGQMYQSGGDTIQGLFRNWYEIPYIDLSKPWYTSSMMQENIATINGKCYLAASDILLSYAKNSSVVLFDKVYAESYEIPDVYEVVREGKWTLDTLAEWTKDIYTDLNGDGKKDENDFYGFTYRTEGCNFTASLYALGVRFAEVKDGKVEMIFNNEKTVAVFDKIQGLLNEPGVLSLPINRVYPYDMVKNGRTVVGTMSLHNVIRTLRDYENDYGIIPMPKYDEAQEQYYSVSDGGSNILAVLTTAQNLEMIGAVTEALSAESWRSVMPVLCDVTLGTKMARDPESQEMIRLVLDSRYIDFPYLFDNFKGWVMNMDPFLKNDGAFVSTYEKKAKSIQKYYDKMIAYFYEE